MKPVARTAVPKAREEIVVALAFVVIGIVGVIIGVRSNGALEAGLGALMFLFGSSALVAARER